MWAASDSCAFIICQASDQEKWSKTSSGFNTRVLQFNIDPLRRAVKYGHVYTRVFTFSACPAHCDISLINEALQDCAGMYRCIKNINRNIYSVMGCPFSPTQFIRTINTWTQFYSLSACLAHTFIHPCSQLPAIDKQSISNTLMLYCRELHWIHSSSVPLSSSLRTPVL